METYPGSSVNRQYMGRADMVKALSEGSIDFCICSPPVSEKESAQVISRVLHKERACLIMPADHPLADKYVVKEFSDSSGDIALCHNINMQYTSAHKRFEAFVTSYFDNLQ